MSAPDNWSNVINDADDETARLILKLQLDDIEQIEAGGLVSADSDEESAFRRYKAELQHHRALWNTEPEDDSVTGDGTPSPPTLKATAVVPTFECIACSECFHVDHVWQAPCSHWYCDADLSDLFRACMTDQALYPPRCCRQQISFDDVRLFVDRELRAEFETKREELDATKTNTGTYCYAPHCSDFIDDGHKDGSVGTCPSCNRRTCVLCKHEAHGGDCPEDETLRQTEDLAQQQGWRRCPDCRRMVELSYGCNHMTCLCSAQFCYVCGARWRTCTCPQFEERNLIIRAEEIGRREGRRDVAALAEGLRENHDCHGNHQWQNVRGGHRCDECTQRLPSFIFRCTRCRMQACRRCRDNRL